MVTHNSIKSMGSFGRHDEIDLLLDLNSSDLSRVVYPLPIVLSCIQPVPPCHHPIRMLHRLWSLSNWNCVIIFVTYVDPWILNYSFRCTVHVLHNFSVIFCIMYTRYFAPLLGRLHIYIYMLLPMMDGWCYRAVYGAQGSVFNLIWFVMANVLVRLRHRPAILWS